VSNLKGSLARLVLLVVLLGGCAGKGTGGRGAETFPPNMRVIYQPIEVVWDELLNILRYDYLFIIEVTDVNNRFFATELIRDEGLENQVKFRVSGSLKFDGKGIVVVLYKQIEERTAQGWVTRPSDYVLEKQILDRLNAAFK
jgi:hypothetical protein